jgi:hypothetical protein
MAGAAWVLHAFAACGCLPAACSPAGPALLAALTGSTSLEQRTSVGLNEPHSGGHTQLDQALEGCSLGQEATLGALCPLWCRECSALVVHCLGR